MLLVVSWSVCRSEVHRVSTDYLENLLSQCFHSSHVDWSYVVDDLFCFLATRSKVKVIVTLNIKMFSAYFLGNHIIQKSSYFTCRLMTPIDFRVSRLKVMVTVTMNVKMVSPHFLKNYYHSQQNVSRVRNGGMFVIQHFFFSKYMYLNNIVSDWIVTVLEANTWK